MGLIEKNDNGSWKLKDYEETGLMPDKVLELNEETQEQARAMLERVAKLSDEIEKMKGQERQQWIPVTERLPEPESYVLVAFENVTRVDIASYRIDENGDGAFYPGVEDTSYVSVGIFVMAWKPLPEIYRE